MTRRSLPAIALAALFACSPAAADAKHGDAEQRWGIPPIAMPPPVRKSRTLVSAPEPATLLLVGAGLAAALARRRR
jgi:hypothetical protein